MSDRAERLRDRAVSQMHIILKAAEAITDATGLETIPSRLDILESRYRDFTEYEVALFADDKYQSITEQVDNVYYNARELLLEASAKRKPVAANAPELNTTLDHFVAQQRTFYKGINSSTQARLPKITIAPFSGEYQYWPSFHDLYKTTVHDSKNLSNVHKFQILSRLLKGDAASLIRHISITDVNYLEAWEKLCNRYNKLHPIIHSHIKSLFTRKPCHQANGIELRHIVEHTDEVIRGLRALGPEAETRDPWLIYMLLSKIDDESKQLWAKHSVDKSFPSVSEFIEFINVRCDTLEIYEPSKKAATTTKYAVKSFVTSSEVPSVCVVCQGSHFIYKCPTFKNMPSESRDQTVVENMLCRNCLRKGHISNKCYNETCCLICNKRHHTLLHNVKFKQETSPPSPPPITNHHICCDDRPNSNPEIKQTKADTHTAEAEISQKTTLHTLYESHDTILPTAVVYVRSCTGQLQLARILLDSGSQTSFVTESCTQRLGLKRTQAKISIHGLASIPAGITKEKTDMTLISRIDQHYSINLEAHILPHIASLIPAKYHRFSNHPILTSLQLAEPNFHNGHEIDILAGADICFELLLPEKQRVSGLPILQNSKLGWLLAGRLKNNYVETACMPTVCDPTTVNTYEDDVRILSNKSLQLEEIPGRCSTDPIENWCTTYDTRITTQDANGRVCVRLPFKLLQSQLGNSWRAAQRRLLPMEKNSPKLPETILKARKDVHDNMIHHSTSSSPRSLITNTISRSIQICSFCDTYEAAYGGVIRPIDEISSITVRRTAAKGKISY